MNCWKCKQPCKHVKATCTRGFIVNADQCPKCKRVFYSHRELKTYESKTGADNFPVVEGVWTEVFTVTRLNLSKRK